jgi:hypothetical protein
MVTFLITSVLFLGLIAIAIYFWQKPANARQTVELPPAPPVTSLFESEEPKQLTATTTGDEQQVLIVTAESGNKADETGNSKPLPNELIDSWRKSPDRTSTTRLLHAAALSDDANTYCNTVELVLNAWQDGGISGMSAAELQNLLNSEFWLLSSNTRNSGAGFVLKRTLSRAKRELERANN